jgi:hypothetical protein
MSNIIRRAILAIALIAGIAPAIAQVPPPVPALPDTERRTSYSLTASTCACTVNMALYGDSTDYWDWIEVFINGAQVQYNDAASGWAITSPTGPLGNIARPITDAVLTFNNPQTGVIQIVGARRPRRTSQFAENTGVSARNLNQVITDIVAMLREVWDKINDVTGRVVRAPPGETLSTLPPLANRASMGACFDSGGNLVPCVAAPSGSFAAGSGITFTGAGPTTISTATYAAGNGIALSGTNPTIISTVGGAAFFGAIGYAPTGGDCSAGSAGAPDDTAALTISANQSGPVQLAQNRCYKITSTVVMTTNGAGLVGDRSSTIWMPAASFNSNTLCSTLNCFNANSLGFYIQGQLSTPFNAIDRIVLSGFRIASEVVDGRSVGAIAIRNATNAYLINLEIFGFPVGSGIYGDTIFNTHISDNYIHDFTTNAVWGSSPGIQAITVDGSRVNGTGSRFNFYQNNNIQNIIFGSVTTAAWTQQPVGIGVYTVNPVGESVISGNTINTTGECIDIYASRITIVGNTMISCEEGAINIKHGGSYNLVGHNILYGNWLYGITLSGGAAAPATTNNLIDGNLIYELDPTGVNAGAATSCIRFNNNGQTFTDSANIIQNNFCDASGGKYGLFGDSSDGASNSYNNNTIVNASVADIAVASSTAQPSGGFTVAQLNASQLACNTGKAGLRYYANDVLTTPAFGVAPTGGGGLRIPVICNGSTWVAG